MIDRAKMPVAARFHGAFTGLAVGDALGAAVEFQPPGTFASVDEMRPSSVHGTPAGAFTDDASTALCLAWSLIENKGAVDPADQMRRYLRWYREGYMSSTGECFDIGAGTRMALEEFERAGRPFQGNLSLRSAGAGALARMAPVLMSVLPGTHAISRAVACTWTTHGAPEAIDASRYFAVLLSSALWARELDDVPAEELKPLVLSCDPSTDFWGLEDHTWDPKIAKVIGGSYRELKADAIHDDGYVVDCLEAALWALDKTDSFEAGMTAAANLGRDSDTRCAIYGQLAGAIYGMDAIPQRWRDALIMEEEFRGVTQSLASVTLRNIMRAQLEMLGP